MSVLVRYEIKKLFKKKSVIASFVILFVLQVLVAVSANLGNAYDDEGNVTEMWMERNARWRREGVEASGTEISDPSFYEQRQAMMGEFMDSFDLSEAERSFWEEKAAELPDTIVYRYADAYAALVQMNGMYMSCLLLCFFIAVAMVNVFAEENACRTDALVLCTRHGRKKLYEAKILGGSVVILGTAGLFVLAKILGSFWCYGWEGFDCLYQSLMEFSDSWKTGPSERSIYPYLLTVGQMFLIMLGILFLSVLLVGIVTMLLAQITKSVVGTMAVIVGSTFASRLVMLPYSWGIFSKLWNCFPLNVLYEFQGFRDLRLYALGGLRLTIWQFVPVFYLVLWMACFILGRHAYCRSQVGG